MNFRERLASIFSYIFHPLLMPLAGVFIIFNSGTTESLLPPEFSKYIYLLVAGGTFVLPLCLLPLYLYWKVASTPYLNQPKERNTPLIFTFILYFLTAYYLFRLPVQYLNLTIFFITGCTLSVLLNFIINTRWKISSHLIGIGGIIGLIAVMRLLHYTAPLFFLLVSIIAGGILLWARLEVKAHSWKQALAGLGLGFVTVFVMVAALSATL